LKGYVGTTIYLSLSIYLENLYSATSR